jgi:hypothetical protein
LKQYINRLFNLKKKFIRHHVAMVLEKNLIDYFESKLNQTLLNATEITYLVNFLFDFKDLLNKTKTIDQDFILNVPKQLKKPENEKFEELASSIKSFNSVIEHHPLRIPCASAIVDSSHVYLDKLNNLVDGYTGQLNTKLYDYIYEEAKKIGLDSSSIIKNNLAHFCSQKCNQTLNVAKQLSDSSEQKKNIIQNINSLNSFMERLPSTMKSLDSYKNFIIKLKARLIIINFPNSLS